MLNASTPSRVVTLREETTFASGELVQDSLCYKNRPDVHLNENGYALLAELLHQRGAKLGYWPSCGQLQPRSASPCD